MKEKFQTAKAAFINAFPFVFTIVGAIATTWYFLTEHNVMDEWWSLPLLAGVSGISLLIPLALKKEVCFPLWSIPFAGITILLYQILSEFCTFDESWSWALLLIPITLASEMVAHKTYKVIHIADVVIDIILSFIAAGAIVHRTHPYEIFVIVIALYFFAIIFDFHVNINIKGNFWPCTEE